nr:Mariner Mos1 transposase [Hymenolepis microstoma]
MVKRLLVTERVCENSGDFAVEDRHSGGREKVVQGAELEAILSGNSCQTQEDLSESLGISQQVISKRLKQLGMIEKGEHWESHELKSRDFERCLFACEQLTERQTRKCRKSWGLPGGYTATSTPRPNEYPWLKSHALRLVRDQLGVIYYELLKPSQTITDVASSHFHLTHLARWHTAWLTSTSPARMKK